MIRKLPSIIFFSRGILWFLSLSAGILIKYHLHGTTPLPFFILGSGIVGSMEVFRVYSGGYLHGGHPVATVKADFLSTSGPFAHVRNPLYAANVLRGTGVCVAIYEWYAFPLFFLVEAAVYSIIIPHEERFLQAKFGQKFSDYKAFTRRFIPRLKPYRSGQKVQPNYGKGLVKEIHTILIFAGVLTIIYVLFAR